MNHSPHLTKGTGRSIAIQGCQVCQSKNLQPVLFVGYLPPVNTMPTVGTRPSEQPAYPAHLVICQNCQLCQLELIVDPQILFPPTYPYTSGTTRILRENFAELYQEIRTLYPLKAKDLTIDIGSNDGTLLSNFHKAGHRVWGIEPTNAGQLANQKGIETLISFFDTQSVSTTLEKAGKAKVVTITNCFAHIEDVHSVMKNVLELLSPNGLFITESHYLGSLVRTIQYDTVYHEHLRYYSLTSLKYLLEMHGLEVIHTKEIPTHGGSIRVYSARKGMYPVNPSVKTLLDQEKYTLSTHNIQAFQKSVVRSKLGLYALLKDIKERKESIFGIGAPSRASTLINYLGLDNGILDCVVEIKGSYKIGKYMPGTLIPVVEESVLFEEQPDYALLLSWHIADELIPKLKQLGFRGKFIVPLPEPHIVKPNSESVHTEYARAHS